ncbi:MAG TPA: Na+/H+ antiporter [Bryobacteraceae bacterium]|nr:Na+/H+ antiporter [Bryobacteraceae bacterium]
MAGTNIHAVELVLLVLFALIIFFVAVARRVKIPYPIVLVVAGLLIGLLPRGPRVALDPDVVFLIVLPPLLYSAAWQTSWREFSRNFLIIFLLAFGLVGFTAFGVAAVAPSILPGFDWRSGFVLGAVVATTDAVAATSIAKRIGLPQRIVDILEGESLVNDATGLLALEVGVSMLQKSDTPSVLFSIGRLLQLTFVGIALGLLVGFVVDKVERFIEDSQIEIAISLLIPYGVYMAANALHASGILAVVACGLYLSRRSTYFFSPWARIQIYAVWDSLVFLLNGIVFILIGLQLPYVRAEITHFGTGPLLLYCAVFSAVLILLRLFWVYPATALSVLAERLLLHRPAKFPGTRRVFVVGWTGMRGVVALAAALSVPAAVGQNVPFRQRNLIIFLTYSVILVTLVLQGLSLPALIRKLGLAGADGENCEEYEARRMMLEAARSRLEQLKGRDPDFENVYEHVDRHYQDRLLAITHEEDVGKTMQEMQRFRHVTREMRHVERETAINLRNQRRISDELLRKLERELDLLDSRAAL